jgi:hypothetical protein
MYPHPLIQQEIARYRHADLLREATQARLEHGPRERLGAQRLPRLLHLRRAQAPAAIDAAPAANG